MPAHKTLNYREGLFLVALWLGLLLFLSIDLLFAAAPEPAGVDYVRYTRRLTADGAPIIGEPDAPVTVVVFVDYACPHCAAYLPSLQTFIEQSIASGKARLEMRILTGLAPGESDLAAQGVLCAREQNSFWEMQEVILRAAQDTGKRQHFTVQGLEEMADSLGLNAADFRQCLQSEGQYDSVLQNNVDLARQAGVRTLPAVLIRTRGTEAPQWPTLNGQPLTGALSNDALVAVIRAAEAD
ncbi:MAG: hypothetical protein Kow0077_03970 [Anaerolineae bacterium]